MAVSYGRLYHTIPTVFSPQYQRAYTVLADLSRVKAPITNFRDYSRPRNKCTFLVHGQKCFSSKAILRQPQREPQREPNEQEQPQVQKRKSSRSPTGKTSLRRVAVEAQSSRGGVDSKKLSAPESPATTKVGPGETLKERMRLINGR